MPALRSPSRLGEASSGAWDGHAGGMTQAPMDAFFNSHSSLLIARALACSLHKHFCGRDFSRRSWLFATLRW